MDKAIEDLSQAIKVNPNQTDSYHHRAICLMATRRLAEALRDGDTLVKLKPTDPESFATRGAIHSFGGQPKKAILDFSEAIRLDPRSPSHHTSRGSAYGSIADWELALQDYNAALKLDGNFWVAWINRSSIRSACPDAKLRDGKKAIEDAQQAIKVLKNSPMKVMVSQAEAALASAYAEAGQFDEAVKWQQKALENPFYKNSLGGLGQQNLKLYEAKKPRRIGQ
ncbi:MAG TPA: tetratricopeptide repeat protein [Urbifossiella sp.]|nr:tetratricopeptide repeat protein [Urbifossiella sp.]